MSKRVKRSKKRFVWFASALCAATLSAAVIEHREIQVEQVKVTQNKGIMFPVVGILKKGDTLDVLEKQTDGWLKVQLNAKEGYVWANALSPPPNGGLLAGLNVTKMSGDRGDPTASGATASAAAKGIKEGAQFYADTNSYKMDGLEEMIDARDSVVGNPWFDFLREGKVGPFK